MREGRTVCVARLPTCLNLTAFSLSYWMFVPLNAYSSVLALSFEKWRNRCVATQDFGYNKKVLLQ